MNQLKEKHPLVQEAQLGSLLFGPVLDIPDVVYQKIDGEMVKEAALRTKGSAKMARRLCTQYIDPSSIEALLANRLLPLDKGEGAVRPIGVGEVLRRIIG